MRLAIAQLIADFGGVTRLASLLAEHFPAASVSRGAIYKWRERGCLPLVQAERLRLLAQRLGQGFELADYLRDERNAPVPMVALRVLDVTLAAVPAGEHRQCLTQLDGLRLTGICLGTSPGALSVNMHTMPWLEAPVREVAVWLAAQALAGHGGGVRLCLEAAAPPDVEELRRCLRLLDSLGLRTALRLPVRADWPAPWQAMLRQVAAWGVDSLTLEDATRHWVPEQWAEAVRRLHGKLGGKICVGVCCHNRHGLALANALAALRAGARQLDCTLLGEHATPLMALAATLETHADRYPTQLNLPARALARVSALTAR